MFEDISNENAALMCLDLINAEFKSDPQSVQCFDLRLVQKVDEIIQQRKRLERKGIVPPLLTGR